MLNATVFEATALWVVLGIAIMGLAYALFLRRQIMAEDKGTDKMQEVWNAIRAGADAYLGRQLRTILPLIVVLTVALFFSVYVVPPSPEASEWYLYKFGAENAQATQMIFGFGRAAALTYHDPAVENVQRNVARPFASAVVVRWEARRQTPSTRR